MATTDSEGEGWKVVQRKEVDLRGLPPAQREREEIRYIRDWEKTPGGWSGLGKHITNAKQVHADMRLESDHLLGTGAYGQVEAVVFRHVGLARKRILSRRLAIEQLREEAHVMERLDHAHIIRLVGTYTVRRCEIFLLLWPVAVCSLADFLDDLEHLRAGTGDREDIIARIRALGLKDPSAVDGMVGGAARAGNGNNSGSTGNCPWRFLQRITGCLAQALAHIHDADVRHLDLKPSNILLNPDRVYIADFGIARGLDDGEGTMTVGGRGTKKWRAPETWDMDNKWSMQAVDVYALGLVYLAIATALYRSPYWDYDALLSEPPAARPALLGAYVERLRPLALTPTSSPDAIATPRPILDFTEKMLAPEARARPRAKDVDLKLCALGGIEQVYHGVCCRKANTFLALNIDERHAAVCAEGRRLRAESERMAREVEGLRKAGEAFAARAEKEKRALGAKLAEEVEKRKALEGRVGEMERMLGRRRGPPASGLGHGHGHGGGHGQAGPGLEPGVRTNGNGYVYGPGSYPPYRLSKSPSIPRPQAQPVQRVRSTPTRASSDPSDASSVGAPRAPSTPLGPASVPPKLSASFSSVAARGTISSANVKVATSTAVSAIPTPSPIAATPPKAAAAAAASVSSAAAPVMPPPPSPSPNALVGYSLRSRSSTSRLPLPVTPRTSTPATPSRDPTDSTQASMASSIFSRRSLESLPTPVVGTPVARVRQGTWGSPLRDADGLKTPERRGKQDQAEGQAEGPEQLITQTPSEDEDAEEDEDDEDDDNDGSVLWTTLPEKRPGPPQFRTWSSVVSSAPSDTSLKPSATPRRPPSPKSMAMANPNSTSTLDLNHMILGAIPTSRSHADSLTEIPPPLPLSPSVSASVIAPLSPPMSTQSSPRLARADIASVSSAGEPRRPPTLSPMKSWAEVASDAVSRTTLRLRMPVRPTTPVVGEDQERGKGPMQTQTQVQAQAQAQRESSPPVVEMPSLQTHQTHQTYQPNQTQQQQQQQQQQQPRQRSRTRSNVIVPALPRLPTERAAVQA